MLINHSLVTSWFDSVCITVTRLVNFRENPLYEYELQLFDYNVYSRPKVTLHFSFLNISILVLILSKWNIAISFQHFSTHNS